MRFCMKHGPTIFAALLVSAAAATTARGDDGAAGVVRISDRGDSSATDARGGQPAERGIVYRAQSPDTVVGACPSGICGDHPGQWTPCGCGDPNCAAGSICHRGFHRTDLHAGNGTYDIVYAVNPCYFDRRDGRVYSAYGYGVPMAVPLAPNVEYTYNFGWGVPSGRLTPVSRPGFPCPR
jgi:hypothetical protein